jgi:hypothetical protein
MSPEQLSLAVNGGGVYIPIGVDGSHQLGPIRAPLRANKMKIICRTDDSYGTDEIMALSLRYLNSANAIINVTGITLTPANVPAAGEVESALLDVTGLKVGDVPVLIADYTVGATPDNPALSVQIEFT